jgi:lipoprotein-releasing system permease protein
MLKRIPYLEGNSVGFERFVSRRYLHPKGRTVAVSVISWISLLGVTIGVMVLIVVISVMNGFQSDLIKKVIGAYSHVVLDTVDYTGDFDPAYRVLKAQ